MVNKMTFWVIVALIAGFLIFLVFLADPFCIRPPTSVPSCAQWQPTADEPLLLPKSEIDVGILQKNEMTVQILNNNNTEIIIPDDLRLQCKVPSSADYNILDVPFTAKTISIKPNDRAIFILVLDMKRNNPGFVSAQSYSCRLFVVKEGAIIMNKPFIINTIDQIYSPSSSISSLKCSMRHSSAMGLCG